MNFELLKARKEAGLTQQEVAEKANMTRDRYQRIETEKVTPTVEEAFAISGVVMRKIEEIFLSSCAQKLRKSKSIISELKPTGTD